MKAHAQFLDDKRREILFTCDDNIYLETIKDICGGHKLRMRPEVIFPALSLPKLARTFPKHWREILDESTQHAATAIGASVKSRIEYLQALRDEYNAPGPISFNYEFKGIYAPLRHQLTMAKAVANVNKVALLADPGTCKTAAYLWGAHVRILRGEVKRVLVITLSHLKDNVVEEARKQAPDLRCIALNGSAHADKVINKKFKKSNPEYDVYISNYESMRNIVDKIPDAYFDMIVCDEAHRIGSHQSQQTKAIVSEFEFIPYKYIVTGTLVANNELSFYMPFRFMGPDTVPEADYECFRSKHFYTVDPDRRIWVPEPTTRDLVRVQIAKTALRFRKEDCLDLPGVIHNVIKYELKGDQAEAHESVKKDLLFTIRSECGNCKCQDMCDTCPNTLLIKSALVSVNKQAQICCGFFLETKFSYDEAGKEKKEIIVHWMKENGKLDALMTEINNIPYDNKIIIWSDYTAGIKILWDKLALAYGKDSVIPIYGDVDAYAANERFRDDPKLRFCVANPAKAGTGLNMQFGHEQLFFSNSCSYIKRDQAEGRQDRQGQKEKVRLTDFLGRCNGAAARDSYIYNTIILGKKELAHDMTAIANVLGLGKGEYGRGIKPPDQGAERCPWD